MNKQRLNGIFGSFQKIAEDLPPVDPSRRVRQIMMNKAAGLFNKEAICPEMLGMETIGETGLEAKDEEKLEEEIEEAIPGADAEVVSAKKVTTVGSPDDGAAVIKEEISDAPDAEEDEKQSDVGELGAEFPPEKLEQLKTLIDEYTQFLQKAGAEIPMGKGIDPDDNQEQEEVPTQIAKNSPINTEPKGVSASHDQTKERKTTEEAQSGEHNEKVAGEVMRETEHEINDLTDPKKAIPKGTSMAGLRAAQKKMQGTTAKKKMDTTADTIGAKSRGTTKGSTIDKAKADKDSYYNMRKNLGKQGAEERAKLLSSIKDLSAQLGIIK
jgi:hypothetical protein